MSASSWKGREFSRRCSRLLPSRPGARGPWAHSHPYSRAHLLRSTCGLDARPRPHARPESRPWGVGRAGAAEARPHARPSQSGAAVSDVGLRAAASGPRGGGTGSWLGLPARSSAARAAAGSEAGRAGWPRRLAPLRQARHAGPRREREPRAPGRAALHRRVRGGPLRERRAYAQFRHLPAGAARRRGLQHVDA